MTQNFSKQNLRGRCFQGQDLAGVDFSDADIQGANFRGAILREANFAGSKTGLQLRWAIGLVAMSFLLLSIPELMLFIANGILAAVFHPELAPQNAALPGLVFLCLLATFSIAIARQGLAAAFKTVALCLATVLTIVTMLSLAQLAKIVPFVQSDVAVGVFTISISLLIALSACVIMSGLLSLAFAVGGSSVIALYSAGLFIRLLSKITTLSLYRNEHSIQLADIDIPVNLMGPAVIDFAIRFFLIFLSIYMGWKTAVGDSRFASLRRVVIPLAAIGGTSFRDADLTDANFTWATLKGADLRRATLVRTCWRKVRKLSRARLGKSYLQDDRIRQLVIQGQGQNQSFERADLRNLNLNGANLSSANLTGADLSQTTLQSSNLFGARVLRSRFERVDLSGACITGIVLDDWNAMQNARLDNVECKYIFLESPKREALERIPAVGDFQQDEFRIFSRSVLDTLDIYHNHDLNPQAAEAALNSLAADYFSGKADPLELVALQETEEKAIIKLKVPEQADRALLLAEYFARYYQLLQPLTRQPAGEVLREGACTITRLSELFEALSQHSSETLYFYNNEPLILGETVNTRIDRRRIQKIDMGGGDLTVSGAAALASGDISGTVANTLVHQQAESPVESEVAALGSLCVQLKDAIATTPNLTDADRAEALRQTSLLQAIVSGTCEKTIEQQARRAVKILKGMALEVPTAARFAKICNQLNLPESTAADSAQFQQQIEQLKQEIEIAPEFTTDLKMDALEQVKILTNMEQYLGG